MQHLKRTIATGLAMLSLGACGGGGGGGSDGNGRLSLSLTDAPTDGMSSVVIQFSGVAFKRSGAAPETVQNLTPSPRQFDLLQYQQGRAALLLDGVTLPAGDYEWIRLIVDDQPNVRDSYVTLKTGEECELTVPSGAESGLKLNRGFTLPADGSAALTVDFDLRQSLHAPPGQHGSTASCTQGYLLRPTLRVVEDANVGAVAGTVATPLITTGCMPKVYLFSGANVVPDDIEETSATTPDVDPMVTADVTADSTGTYRYRLAFIPPGPYTASFTCSADDPTADEALVFSGTQNVTVQANLIGTADFTAPPAP